MTSTVLPPRRFASTVLARLGLLIALLLAEWLPISAMVSSGRGGQSLARPLVAFLFLAAALGYYRLRNRIQDYFQELDNPHALGYLAGHAGAMGVFLALSRMPNTGSIPFAFIWVAWLGSGLLGIAMAACAFAPPRCWLGLGRAGGRSWIVAAIGSVTACSLIDPLRSGWSSAAWSPLTDSTFALATFLLRPIFRDLISDRASTLLGTPRFGVEIQSACSGMEGMGLILIFSIGWLWFLRREFRFPQALFLIPAGVAVMWFANGVRIAILIIIGNAGAPQIAMGGFHSQAGWIAFNVVALGVVLLSSRVPWWSRQTGQRSSVPAGNPAAPYLAPFLLVLASAMISRAVSSGFEWFYALRLIAAVAILWSFRSKYAGLNWRCGWWSPAAGVIVFLLWISLDALSPPKFDNGMASVLARSSLWVQVAWLTFRTVAAVVTVPIVEELAFRGFLIRRLMTADFESLSLQAFTWPAVLLSSVGFGLLHGQRWMAGSLAGLIYAGTMIRRGRIGDAVFAHATTNALIAIAVLAFGKWNLW